MKQVGCLFVITTALLLQGCIYADAGPGDGIFSYSRPTIGQELLDLERARLQGVISDEEFYRLKQIILDDRS